MSGNSLKTLLLTIVFMFSLSGCVKLDVENLNDPDFSTFYATPDNITSLAGGLINKWFMAVHGYNGLAFPLLTAADASTCSWGITYSYSLEPRIEFNNSPSFANSYQNIGLYGNLYSTLTGANDVLGLIRDEDTDLGDTPEEMVRAVALFVQGLSLGYIGLVYDKAFIINEKTDIKGQIPVSSWKDIIAESVSILDRVIEICNVSNFTLPSGWLPGEIWNSHDLVRLASSFAARLLAYSPRNKTDDNATDWAKVYEYASNGITRDFAPLADDIIWYSLYHSYANYGGFGRTDMYVVNMMDPAMPSHWEDENTWNILPPPVTSHRDGVDDRIFNDYQYLSWCEFRAERGYYHFSCYRYKRLDTYLSTRTEPIPEFRKTENDYLLAEAAARTGGLQEAADIINSSPRVTRGGLPPVPAEGESILAAIHHERMVELMSSGFGIQFFQMRKENKLQPGSPLHYPIPGSQLEIMRMNYYTFGGKTGVPGEDYSTGGW